MVDMKDIEDRAQEYLNTILPATSGELIKALNAYRDAMTEERERWKRFIPWLFENNLPLANGYSFQGSSLQLYLF